MTEKLLTLATAEEYLAWAKTEATKAVADVLTKFDFGKAARILAAGDWKYEGADHSPTAEQLQTMATRMVKEAVNYGPGYACHSGPLTVEVRHWGARYVPSVELTLRPVRSSAVYMDARFLFKQVKQKA